MFEEKEAAATASEPTRVVLEFEAAGDINPNGEGRASPLGVRIYQLKSYSVFEKADFFSLYDNDEQVLGGELVKKQEILLKPNEKRTVFFETEDDTQTIGLLGRFHGLRKQPQWKAAAGVQANKTTVIQCQHQPGRPHGPMMTEMRAAFPSSKGPHDSWRNP